MKYQFLLTALFLLATSSVVAADGRETQPTTEEIVTRMAAHDLARQASIEGYAGMRRYVLENQKLHKRAEMLVQVQGDKDGTKHFDVVSEDGWKAAHKHVLHKMLESETETSIRKIMTFRLSERSSRQAARPTFWRFVLNEARSTSSKAASGWTPRTTRLSVPKANLPRNLRFGRKASISCRYIRSAVLSGFPSPRKA